MPRRALQFGIFCLLISAVAGRNPLCAQALSKADPAETRLVQQSPDPAKTKGTAAGEKKTASVVQLSQTAAPSAEDVQRTLNDPGFDAEFIDTPLAACIEFFRDATGLNFVIDQQALAKKGVAMDVAVTCDQTPVALARCLDRILEPLDLTWFVHDNMIQVTTKSAAEEILVTRTYRVAEILKYAKTHRPDPGPGVSDGGPAYEPIPRDAPLWLMSLLQDLTSGPWTVIDGMGGSISYFENHLVVRQTHKVQTEIDQILKTLRQFTQVPLIPKAVAIHPPYYGTQEDEAVRKALAKTVSISADKMPVGRFLDEVAWTLDVPLVLDQPALAKERISLDERVTAQLQNVPARSVLDQALTRFSLTVLAVDGQLFVTTIPAAEKRLVTTLYDVRDLGLRQNSGPASPKRSRTRPPALGRTSTAKGEKWRPLSRDSSSSARRKKCTRRFQLCSRNCEKK